MKTNELEGAALDWAVAKCEGDAPVKAGGKGLEYSTDWLAGGPIIEQKEIFLVKSIMGGWTGSIRNRATGISVTVHSAPTPLIAAMRCYVASTVGDEIEVPEGI